VERHTGRQTRGGGALAPIRSEVSVKSLGGAPYRIHLNVWNTEGELELLGDLLLGVYRLKLVDLYSSILGYLYSESDDR
jgi:hypothetical protein